MSKQSNEGNITLAIEAIRKDPKMSIRRAAVTGGLKTRGAGVTYASKLMCQFKTKEVRVRDACRVFMGRADGPPSIT